MKKLIISVNHYDNGVSFDLVFVNSSATKTEVIERVHYPVDPAINFFKDDLTEVSEAVKNIIIEKAYTKAPVYLLLNVRGLFIEELTLPRLSSSQAKRSIRAELSRMYPNYKDRFVFDIKIFTLVRKSKKIRVGLYNKQHYKTILSWIKSMKLKLKSVSTAPCALHKGIRKLKLVQAKQPFFFINISEHNTMVLVHKKQLAGFHVFEAGMQPNFTDEHDLINIKNQSNPLKSVAVELRRVLYDQTALSIKDCYVNVEHNANDAASDVLEAYLGKTMTPVDNEHPLKDTLSVIGALYPNKKDDFNFPTKLSQFKDEKKKKPKKSKKKK